MLVPVRTGRDPLSHIGFYGVSGLRVLHRTKPLPQKRLHESILLQYTSSLPGLGYTVHRNSLSVHLSVSTFPLVTDYFLRLRPHSVNVPFLAVPTSSVVFDPFPVSRLGGDLVGLPRLDWDESRV